MDPRAKIRNIAFLDPSDPGYGKFVDESRLANMRIRESKGKREYSDIISELFEPAIREWVAPVGGSEKRILSYERLDRNGRYVTRYRELDFLIDDGNCVYIGELKVSSSTKLLNRAYRQLSESMDVLSRTGKKVKPVLIYINLSYKNARTTVNIFDPDFTKMQFMQRSVNGRNYDFLQLSPVEFFEWAYENNIIADGELLGHALREAEDRFSARISRRDLRTSGIPEQDWPPHLRERKTSTKIFRSGKHNNAQVSQLAHRIREAMGKNHARVSRIGTITLFDHKEGIGEVQTLSSGKLLLPLDSFGQKPSVPLQKGQVITYRRKSMTESGQLRAAGCRLLDTVGDLDILVSLLMRDAPSNAPWLPGREKPLSGSQTSDLLKQLTLQIFEGKGEQTFIDTVQHYYDRHLQDDHFVHFCSYLEHIAVPLIQTDDRDMVEQTLYCYFFANIRSGILFQVWKHATFRYIAYTDGMDYEIPREIIQEYRHQLDDCHWERLARYSYGSSLERS
ncbi:MULTISPECIES: hypothetical protein [Sphingobacterium]|uniref:hypothetical protein n=1 Tax=Sphingobacterium TaxID=28453 RepID=UPI0025811208|nr:MULTISPECIES: hypothetical protein [Sphingobacterium]